MLVVYLIHDLENISLINDIIFQWLHCFSQLIVNANEEFSN